MSINIKELESKLNLEYKNLGKMLLKEAHNDKIAANKIKYIDSIMSLIKPISDNEPIIVSEHWGNRFKLIDGYHRLKNAIQNGNEYIDVIVLDDYNIVRYNDTFFNFLRKQTGKTIKFVDNNLIYISNQLYFIEFNEGCGGCSNGWSDIEVLPKFKNKEIVIKLVAKVVEHDDSDFYDLVINGKKIAEINTGWGNGYYGGDFKIKLIN